MFDAKSQHFKNRRLYHSREVVKHKQVEEPAIMENIEQTDGNILHNELEGTHNNWRSSEITRPESPVPWKAWEEDGHGASLDRGLSLINTCSATKIFETFAFYTRIDKLYEHRQATP